MKKSAWKISFVALAACFICVCAQIALPIGGVPLTLQTFAVIFCGYLLGTGAGVSATAVYLLLGAVGLPVFAGFGASLAFLLGPTGGFLFGFLPLAFFCGIASRIKKVFFGVLLSALGLLLCHAAGVIQFSFVTGTSPLQAFLAASLPYLPKDLLSILLARFLLTKIQKRLPRAPIFRNET